MKDIKKITGTVIIVLLVITIFAGCSPKSKKEITFANAGWDSNMFHNAVAGLIVKEIYGYDWREIPGTTPVTHEGLLKGEIDVHMEIWTDNIPTYMADIKEDKLKELGINFDDNYQGFYVPRYVIEGDESRGIEASAPDLKYVWDLKKYAEVFPDYEDPDMGRVYGAIPGWEVDTIMHNKYLHYGLDENFVYFRPGSDPALSAAITDAYERGEPIVAYYWEPTWLIGKYDFVLLEDEPFDENTYLEGKTTLPTVKVAVGVSNDFAESAPKGLLEFLSKYKTSSALTSEALAHMQDENANYEETAKWFLKTNDNLIDEWLTPDEAQIIRDFLK
ncbi:MAG: ABC transporter substrate-binding protein [Natronincolaceae bacterium]|jgi:glycine betaine/proline transport system substrate-binding protein|nr:ABC transporter substrate-binding protein [Bacillota bacterium]